MTIVIEQDKSTPAKRVDASDSARRQQIRQELQQKIESALAAAKALPPDECLQEIKHQLLDIQIYCRTIDKPFIVVEEKITCDQYGLGGCDRAIATLFRGPSEDASVAICVTHKGSLLHRNCGPWTIYKTMGDVNPQDCRYAALPLQLRRVYWASHNALLAAGWMHYADAKAPNGINAALEAEVISVDETGRRSQLK